MRLTDRRSLQLLVLAVVMTTAACSDNTGPLPTCIRASATVASNFSIGSTLSAPATAPREIASSDLGAISAGEVKVLDAGQAAGGLQFPSGSTDRNYLIVVGNTDPQHDAEASYVVTANQVAGAATTRVGGLSSFTSPTPARIAHARVPVDAPSIAHSKQRAMEEKIRAFERQNLELKTSSVARVDDQASTRSSVQASVQCGLSVGDTFLIKIPNAATTDLCNNFTPTRAVVAAVSRKAI